jgi:hypothetical protein
MLKVGKIYNNHIKVSHYRLNKFNIYRHELPKSNNRWK